SFREAVGPSAPVRLGKTTLSALGRHPTFDRIRARRNRRGGTGTAGSARTGVAATTSAGAGRGASSTVGRVNRPVQRVIIIALALLLVVPLGVMGLGGLLGPGGGGQAEQDPPAQGPRGPARTPRPAANPPRPAPPRPDEPAGLTQQSAEGAQAALTSLLDSYDYMMRSGDTSVWEDSVDPECQVCGRFLDNAQVLDEQGGYLV